MHDYKSLVEELRSDCCTREARLKAARLIEIFLERNKDIIFLPENMKEIKNLAGDCIYKLDEDGTITVYTVTGITLDDDLDVAVDCYWIPENWHVENGEAICDDEPVAEYAKIDDFGTKWFIHLKDAVKIVEEKNK